MNLALISSTTDPASVNIKEKLISMFHFQKSADTFQNNSIYKKTVSDDAAKDSKRIQNIRLYTIDDPLIHANDINQEIDADIFIFLSKHRAQEGRATLSVHPIGNFGSADFGGKDNLLCPCPSSLLKSIFIELSKITENTGYGATLEATHHGPYLESLVLFLELGSTEEHWNDPKGAEMIAAALIKALENVEQTNESIIVLGGSHYNHVANKAMLKSEFAVGHMCPKYHFANLDELMLLQMIEKTNPKPAFALLDWKGLGSEKQRIISILEKNMIAFKRSDQLF